MSAVKVPNKWDHEADVLVIGAGTAGLPAAIKVAEAGLKATVLESRPACGGSLAMIAGGIAFAGTEEQKEAGIEDSPDVLCENMIDAVGADPKLARAYADNQLEAYRMLKDQGVSWVGVNQVPGHNRCRGLVAVGEGRGPKLVKAFENRARERGVEILFRHRAQRLITDPQTGRVIGVQVSVKDETKTFRAKRAVIIASGGFGHNSEIVAEYAPAMVTAVPKMPVGHQGDGLKMALDIGAATRDIGKAVAGSWPLCVETHSNAIWTLDAGGIMVNVNGSRFHNEASVEGFYGFMTEAGMKQPGGVYWIVYCQDITVNIKRDSHIEDIGKCKKIKADTIEELANLAGIDAEGLKETVARYNGDIDAVGYDTVFGRVGAWGEAGSLTKITAPFYTIKCVTAITSMKGGLKINDRCQVLNNYGEAIPGLYAGGEVAGGLNSKSYLLGTMTTLSMAQGIICGRNAVEEPEG